MLPDSRPVFHDPSGQRRVWALRIALGLGAIFLTIAALFLVSLVAVPVLPPAVGLSAPMRHALSPHLPRVVRREASVAHFLLARDRQRLLASIAQERARVRAHGASAKAMRDSIPRGAPPRVVAAFYATWQETGLHSLRAHADHLTHLMPVWLRIGADGRTLDTHDWTPSATPHNLDVLRIARAHHLRITPVLSNAHEGRFDAAIGHRLLTSSANQHALARETADWLQQHGFAGLNVDLENLAADDVARVPAFLRTLRAELADRKSVV